MPNQSHSGVRIDPWHRCDRCGIEFHVGQLHWQNGLLVCSANDCTDNPLAWDRDKIIAAKLGDSPDEMGIAEVLKGDGNNPEDQF